MSPAVAPQAESSTLPEPWVALLYVPEEFAWADALHRGIDGVATPGALVGRPTRHGFPLPEQVSVFPNPRDAAELARYEQVLPRAKYLVVICSPHSAEADWVERQIKAFKRAGGEDRIIVLVVESERDEQAIAKAGHTDRDWLPAWLRWRLDDAGRFRPATEPGEPLILDARPGAMSLDDARGDLLATVLELPRTDCITPESVAHGEPVAAAPRGGATWARAAAVAFLVAGAGAWAVWPRTGAPPPAPIAPAGAEQAAAHRVPEEAAPGGVFATEQLAAEEPAAPPESEGTPEVIFPAAPAGAPVTVAQANQPAPPVQTLLVDGVEPAPPPAPDPLVQAQASSGDADLDRWRRMRALGDTLFDQRNRDAGLLALTQAAEAGLGYARKPGADATVQLEVARLCYRLGALQHQFASTAEARKTLEGARKILQRIRLQGDLARERTDLLANIATVLDGLSKE